MLSRYIDSVTQWHEEKSKMKERVDNGSVHLFFKLGESNHLFTHAVLHEKTEPGVYIGFLDWGQMSG